VTYETGVDLRGLVAGMFTTYVFWLQLQKTWVMKSVVSVWDSSPRLADHYDQCGHVIVNGHDTRTQAALSG